MKCWYQKNIISIILFPFSLIYRAIIFIRYFFYKIKLFRSHQIQVPVIVVGNITVGGTGKTPLVMALIQLLEKQGFQPGVILRGYGGKSKTWPVWVDKNSNPQLVGDEAVLIAKNTAAPVVVGPKRIVSAKKLLAKTNCNIVISDDGLQHYALARDIEIAVIDGSRRFGNGFCLPAGPLREPLTRLDKVNFLVVNGDLFPNVFSAPAFTMCFILDEVINVKDENIKLSFSALKNKKIRAVAGIGNPERFFQSLRSCDLIFSKTIFPDHHAFQKNDFASFDEAVILMTEKDAVKCCDFADARFWFVRGHVEIDPYFQKQLLLALPSNSSLGKFSPF
ncbi:MAG: tetraacyldisaccharide 4'-kinase [Gammaproteobacteria bacterium CG_4_10_14_0_8_um_filter_38_16]|nr:MAG: tetraacyldisaccharide 4'-kinase [Gammaproteobacteria bacterium CG_4_10_14_0_8_um_filter_38_16]PJA04351.1 MAG: tetraacyldisaccharide 4'-kinase [Gammaproteobacteria bacterium CG_4_10_14_0_2_um_filter_38_22]PJB09540.1 MAG: tetraacyldisaccharide 4'-kinase [Gammaproteobacteria bacterium CG_4_9_14_3_um_filter_38_9]